MFVLKHKCTPTLLTSPVLMMPSRGSSRIGSNEVTWGEKCKMQKTWGEMLSAKCNDETWHQPAKTVKHMPKRSPKMKCFINYNSTEEDNVEKYSGWRQRVAQIGKKKFKVTTQLLFQRRAILSPDENLAVCSFKVQFLRPRVWDIGAFLTQSRTMLCFYRSQ